MKTAKDATMLTLEARRDVSDILLKIKKKAEEGVNKVQVHMLWAEQVAVLETLGFEVSTIKASNGDNYYWHNISWRA